MLNNYSFFVRMVKKEEASKVKEEVEETKETSQGIEDNSEISTTEEEPTTIKERVDQEFSTMLSAYWDANMLQLRSEVWIWWQEKLNKLLDWVWNVWEKILSMDPDWIVENADQYIKLLQLQSATAKRVTQFAWGKDTKDAVVLAEVKPLLKRAERKG